MTRDLGIYSLLSDDKAFGGWFGALFLVSMLVLLALMIDSGLGTGKGGREEDGVEM